MRHFALTVAYDGTSYGGWQIQANSVAVQQILMEAIAKDIIAKLAGTGGFVGAIHQSQSSKVDCRSRMPRSSFAI